MLTSLVAIVSAEMPIVRLQPRNVTGTGGGGGDATWDYNMTKAIPWNYNETNYTGSIFYYNMTLATGDYEYNMTHAIPWNYNQSLAVFNYGLNTFNGSGDLQVGQITSLGSTPHSLRIQNDADVDNSAWVEMGKTVNGAWSRLGFFGMGGNENEFFINLDVAGNLSFGNDNGQRRLTINEVGDALFFQNVSIDGILNVTREIYTNDILVNDYLYNMTLDGDYDYNFTGTGDYYYNQTNVGDYNYNMSEVGMLYQSENSGGSNIIIDNYGVSVILKR